MRLRARVNSLKGKFGEKSKDLVSGFMSLFGRDGRIVSVHSTVCVCGVGVSLSLSLLCIE